MSRAVGSDASGHAPSQRSPITHRLQIRDADTPWQRLIGLLAQAPLPAGQGLRLSPCRAVHTIGMRHAIDILFLDMTGTVLSVTAALKPCRIAANVRARHVLELRAGEAARLGISSGDRIAAIR